MRIILLTLVLISSISLRAQTPLPLSGMNHTLMDPLTHYNSFSNNNNYNKKWSLHKYGGISASYMFFHGGNASVLSAPVGMQLNRRISNNLYAFAGVAVAPAFYNFNSSFLNSDIYKNNPGISRFGTNSFGMYSKFETGLMYINDDRTFSISGSIGVYRSSYPLYPAYNMTNLPTQQPVNGSRQ